MSRILQLKNVEEQHKHRKHEQHPRSIGSSKPTRIIAPPSKPAASIAPPLVEHANAANQELHRNKAVSAADLQARIRASRRRCASQSQSIENTRLVQQRISRPSSRASDITTPSHDRNQVSGHKRQNPDKPASRATLQPHRETELPNMLIRNHLVEKVERSHLPGHLSAVSPRRRTYPASVGSTATRKKSPLSTVISPEGMLNTTKYHLLEKLISIDEEEEKTPPSSRGSSTSSSSDTQRRISRQVQPKLVQITSVKRSQDSDSPFLPSQAAPVKAKTKRHMLSHRRILCAV